jgi:hypothetical protein
MSAVAQRVIERWKRLYGRIEAGEVEATLAQRQMAENALQALGRPLEDEQAAEARRRRLYGSPGPLPWPNGAEGKPDDWPPRVRAEAPDLVPCEFCSYRFDHVWLGRLGCPNCDGKGLQDVPV